MSKENPYLRKLNSYARDDDGNLLYDVYDIEVGFNITNPGLKHALKKILTAGQRGWEKSTCDDIREAIQSLKRALEIETTKEQEAGKQMMKDVVYRGSDVPLVQCVKTSEPDKSGIEMDYDVVHPNYEKTKAEINAEAFPRPEPEVTIEYGDGMIKTVVPLSLIPDEALAPWAKDMIGRHHNESLSYRVSCETPNESNQHKPEPEINKEAFLRPEKGVIEDMMQREDHFNEREGYGD